MTQQLQTLIDNAWDNRAELSPASAPKEVMDAVRIDVSGAHFWDVTAVSALDKAVIKFRREGTDVEVIGLNEASATMIDRFGQHDKADETPTALH